MKLFSRTTAAILGLMGLMFSLYGCQPQWSAPKATPNAKVIPTALMTANATRESSSPTPFPGTRPSPTVSVTKSLTRVLNPVKAFPGAEGFGANTIGGRGGRVIEVTNLDDSGPGSLRAAVEANGPRIVVFRVGGTITLSERIRITNPYITIAGQTAPGGGITLRNDPEDIHVPLQIDTHDVIIRYIRSRPGPSQRLADNLDALTLNATFNVILDHVSASWATDENIHIWYDSHDITIQWSIISEGLQYSTNTKGRHSKGLLIGSVGSRSISVHHNLFAHNRDRNPEVNTVGVVDVVNNVIYDYAGHAAFVEDKYTNAKVPVNFVGNYIKRGVDSPPDTYELIYFPAPTPPLFGASVFVKGNIGPHRPDEAYPEDAVVRPADRIYVTTVRHPAPLVTTTSAFIAYDEVLSKAGVTIPVRDSVDQRIVNDVMNGTGTMLDDPSQVGGWPRLDLGNPPQDSDHDGMPDDWERTRELNPLMDDSAQDRDGDGYTNVEEYINGLVGSAP
jgi:pectate lyase